MWEYKILVKLGLTEEDLNKLGAEEWEHYLSVANNHYFKRHIEVTKPKGKRADKDRE